MRVAARRTVRSHIQLLCAAFRNHSDTTLADRCIVQNYPTLKQSFHGVRHSVEQLLLLRGEGAKRGEVLFLAMKEFKAASAKCNAKGERCV